MDIYEAIYQRRDVREFLSDAVEPAILARVLDAAHHAGSVGFMQPWTFIVVDSPSKKQAVHALFQAANAAAAQQYEGERQKLYQSLKLEGIREAPIGLVVTCDPQRSKEPVLGRHSMPEMDAYSTCAAIQNLWLAARAEGLGVGWVSIIEPESLKRLFAIPEHVRLIAYLCLGYPKNFESQPMLQKLGWRQRLPLRAVVRSGDWEGEPPAWTYEPCERANK